MEIPKKYFHDRLILLLLTVLVFLAGLAIVWVLFKLDSGRTTAYIVQYRANVSISQLKAGGASELVAFIGFAVMVLAVNVLMSIRTYEIRREVSVVILLMGILLLLSSLIVSNALLVIR